LPDTKANQNRKPCDSRQDKKLPLHMLKRSRPAAVLNFYKSGF
jgi:hypothetical protein